MNAETAADDGTPRPLRADAQRKWAALLAAAMDVFAERGVDAPVRDIAARAGVGLGTVYRHFPQRSDLIKAVFQKQVDACADAAVDLAARFEPAEALARWMQRYVDFLATKRGLAGALHSGDPAYASLPIYFSERLQPALQALLHTAIAAKAVRADLDAGDLLHAVASLCRGSQGKGLASARKMIEVLSDGLRYGASTGPTKNGAQRTQRLREGPNEGPSGKIRG